MRIAYLDCASGISGDMTLGAMIDAGVSREEIQTKIDSLNLPSCKLVTEDTKRCGFRATNLTVQHEPEHAHRHLHHITEMIDGSSLTDSQKEIAKRIFQRLGEAEAKVHGTTIQKVHFHEVGAVDSIADIVGCAVGFDLLNVDRICCAPIPTGSGFIEIAHGRCSVPAPATAELLQGIPLAPSTVEAELTTPTGAAIAAAMVDQFGPLPPMQIEQIGYGAGDKDFKAQANLLRIIVGRECSTETADQIVVLETNLDDVTAEVIGHCFERLLTAGALDVFSTAIQMKKNRPGVQLSVLCGEHKVTELESILFNETSTLGVRRYTAARTKLVRSAETVQTEWGPISGKRVTLSNGTTRFSPEYEACREIAERHDLSLQDVMRACAHGA